jgi:uncharacterized protein with NAD-binding domain and iron-sulfur cluster
MKRRRVVIVGGGVAGLTAAHELIERNYDVTVYERSQRLGGKARSIPVDGSAQGNRHPLPGEHGFRFFPGWYRHLFDTLGRIPYPKTRQTVRQNLVAADVNLLAQYGRPSISAPVRIPRSWEGLRLAFKLPQEVLQLIPPDDIEFFMRKMLHFVVSCEERRLSEIEPLSWWEYMEADSRSKAFRDYLVTGATQNSVAAKPRVASAYTIAKMVIQTFTDLVSPDTPADSVLNGPTEDVWIGPWRRYLEAQGVEFKFGWELQELRWANDGEIESLIFTHTRDELKIAEARYLTIQFLDDTIRLAEPAAQTVPYVWARSAAQATYVEELQLDVPAREAIGGLRQRLADIVVHGGAPSDAKINHVVRDATTLRDDLIATFYSHEARAPIPSELLTIKDAADVLAALEGLAERAGFSAPLRGIDWVAGYHDVIVDPAAALAATLAGLQRRQLNYDIAGNAPATARRSNGEGTSANGSSIPHAGSNPFFIFALPIEQMAYYVNKSPTLVKRHPDLVKLIRLSEHVDWMSGVQFFLREKLDITPGHIDCLDSEWSLTAISQTQFWDDVDMKDYGDGTCRGVLSVDISSWSTPGELHDKPAWDCTAQEIAEEVWYQLRRSLNQAEQPELLRDDQLVGGRLMANQSYFLDDSVVDRYDRKKQGLFEKFRRVAFDGGALVDRQLEHRRAADAPEAFGPRLQINAEPLLINRAGSLALRPDAVTPIRNMFLAADYVKTSTNLACMEGANEAARRAVNGILAASGAKDRCWVAPLDEPFDVARLLDEQMLQYGQRLDAFAELPLRWLSSTRKSAAGPIDRARRFLRSRL